MTNRLFVANKPANISSNFFLRKIKRKYGVKKAGFSGTLDPFAQGVLIIAFGQYTKLFRFLNKTQKSYRATLWIGASSPTLDIEKITHVQEVMPFHSDALNIIEKSMIGEIEYLPPKYCAKMVDGVRAYKLAREEKEFELKKIKSTIYDFKILHYMHPFLTFEITISEGDFVYEDEKALNPLEYLKLQDNSYLGDIEDIELGRKLGIENFEKQDEGLYKIVHAKELSVIEIQNKEVKYILNKVELC